MCRKTGAWALGTGQSVGLVVQSVMSDTEILRQGLSATDPPPRPWIWVCTMPKDVDMLT